MPLGRCEKHGLQWAIPMCPTVHGAVSSRKHLPVFVRFDWSDEAHLFCSSCASEAAALMHPGVERDHLAMEQAAWMFEGRLDSECILCVDEWLAALGCPLLTDMLDAERRREGGAARRDR